MSSSAKPSDTSVRRETDADFWTRLRTEASENATKRAKAAEEAANAATSASNSKGPPSAPAPDLGDANIKVIDDTNGWYFVQYDASREAEYLPAIRQLISSDLSEPYSIYVYRYFLYSWPDLCFMCVSKDNQVLAVIVNKLGPHVSPEKEKLPEDERGDVPNRGYIAMIATHATYRKRGIGRKLVRLGVEAMARKGADEVVLETEIDNVASLKLYSELGFLRSKRLHRYYLNGNEAFRLILAVEKNKGGGTRKGEQAAESDTDDEGSSVLPSS